MALVDVLIGSIGSAVVRAVLRVWLQDDGIAKEGALDLEAALKPHIAGTLERRKTRRQLETVADEVALRLERYFSAEFHGALDDGERAAAGDAVARTIDRGLDRDLIFAAELEPSKLALALKARVPHESRRAYLSEAGTVLYDFALREACAYIIEIAVTLPKFQAEATRALLKKDAEIITLIRKVLDNLPEPNDFMLARHDDDAGFETDYRRHVARKLDRLTLFGVDLSEASQRYALSVAYITLLGTRRDRGRPSSEGVGMRADAPPPDKDAGRSHRDSDPDYVRINEVLAESPRIIVKGEAGSGKTTLLQWLAVSCAKRSFTGSLSRLNDSIPYFIQLRRFVDRDLPHPSEFLDYAATPLVGTLPQGWVEQRLRSGDAVVLVDGVDELPENKRHAVREWLGDLCEAYPSARYVVTSRPPAVDEGWLGAEDFHVSELQPMDLSDIDEFVAHWHAAIRAGLADESDLAELGQLEEELRSTVRTVRPIRALATSPLLCAMLCALNRDRRSQLPKDRVELYRIALETLLERRDIERRVRDSSPSRLTRRQREILLEDLAYWLQINGRSDAPVEVAVGRISNKLVAMALSDAEADRVLEQLLLRSGLIRAPVEGRIDFIHRTFQEFLAAREALQQEHIGVLIDNAHRDGWAEVVVLAAGAGSLRQRTELMEGLLARGRSDSRFRHRLHLLAVACLETSPEVPVDLRDDLTTCLAELLPPRNMNEARALSSAGDLAVPLLGRYVKSNVAVARPTIRTLALIASPDALEVLERFATDHRVTIVRELSRAWANFDREEYALRVLAKSPLERGSLSVSSTTVVPHLAHLEHLRDLSCDFSGANLDLVQLSAYPQLSRLRIANNRSLAELNPLGGHDRLRELILYNCPALKDIVPVGTMAALRTLEIHSCPVEDLSPLREVSDLRRLSLVGIAAADGTPIVELHELRSLEVASAQWNDISWLPSADDMRELRLIGMPIRHLDGLDRCHSLASVTLYGSSVVDLTGLDSLRLLEELDLSLNPVADLTQLGTLPQLRNLDLFGTAITTLAGVEGLSKLFRLNASRCASLTDLDAIRSLPQLRTLYLLGSEQIADLSPLGGKSLSTLDIEGCTGIASLEPLLDVKRLGWIDVSYCRPTLDLKPLLDVPGLATVRAYGMAEALERAGLSASKLRIYGAMRHPRSAPPRSLEISDADETLLLPPEVS